MARPAFDPPGAGMWELDRSHYPGGTTPISQWLMQGCPNGMREVFGELGMPAETLDVRFVNGFMYTRLRPLISPDRVMKPPPLPILKLAVRLHPGMRRRAKNAARTLAERPWRNVAAEWESEIRPRLERENTAFADVDVAALDDGGLAAHLEELLAYLRKNFELHFYLHVFDLGPIGMLLYECAGWGIEPPEVIPTLAGASPSTSAPAVALSTLRRQVATAGRRPASLDEVRAISPEAAALLDEYLRRHGRVMVTRYDLDGHTLDEEPDTVLSTILDGADPSAGRENALSIAAELRKRVPAHQQAVFDERLTEARAAMDLRDDNGPNTVELPVGVLRHGLLEAGRRLAARGRLHDAGHALEVEHNEIGPLLRTAAGPSADDLAGRASLRQELAALEPPERLGPEETPPPLDVLSPATQVMVGAVRSVLIHLGMAGDVGRRTESLSGFGIGGSPYRGRARVALDPESALDSMDPGDVLVVRFTTPAYNTVLAIAGAIVTAEGGLLCHAAVMARELGIPAVVGAAGALREIADGSEIEVDPVTGVVRLLRPFGEHAFAGPN
jgi:phosphohistidine swiveling domain-containing protein